MWKPACSAFSMLYCFCVIWLFESLPDLRPFTSPHIFCARRAQKGSASFLARANKMAKTQASLTRNQRALFALYPRAALHQWGAKDKQPTKHTNSRPNHSQPTSSINPAQGQMTELCRKFSSDSMCTEKVYQKPKIYNKKHYLHRQTSVRILLTYSNIWHIWHSIWQKIMTFYLTCILTSSLTLHLTCILTFYPTLILPRWHMFWHSIWHRIPSKKMRNSKDCLILYSFFLTWAARRKSI